LRPGETTLLGDVKLIQFVTAGVDYIPLGDLPAHVPVAANGGAYAESMAEHALAMTLAAVKRLFIEHAALARGEFNQRGRNRQLAALPLSPNNCGTPLTSPVTRQTTGSSVGNDRANSRPFEKQCRSQCIKNAPTKTAPPIPQGKLRTSHTPSNQKDKNQTTSRN
jgi:hypothetical protein